MTSRMLMPNERTALAGHVCIVGASSGSNVGGSLLRAARAEGVACDMIETAPAMSDTWAQKIAWHLGGRRPLRLGKFSSAVLKYCLATTPSLIIATGTAPLRSRELRLIRSAGVKVLNYSTDDPFSPVHLSRWHLAALAEYSAVLTPRSHTIADFHGTGCCAVHHLPFGYDEDLVAHRECTPITERALASGIDLLFVGGADRHRATIIGYIRKEIPDLRVALAGSYWDRYPETRDVTLGQLSVGEVNELTCRSKVCLCLNRRSNRDQHVMRSLEIPAAGGLIIAEDTPEHRELLNGLDRGARLFHDNRSLVEQIRQMLQISNDLRENMRSSAAAAMSQYSHSYRDRLRTILRIASELEA